MTIFNWATPKNLKTHRNRTGGFSTLDLRFFLPSFELATTIDLGLVDWGSDHFPVIPNIGTNHSNVVTSFPTGTLMTGSGQHGQNI